MTQDSQNNLQEVQSGKTYTSQFHNLLQSYSDHDRVVLVLGQTERVKLRAQE